METKRRLTEVPKVEDGTYDVKVEWSPSDLAISYVPRSPETGRGCRVLFSGVRAYRYTAEVHTTVAQIEDAYDTLVEIIDSHLVTELRGQTAARWSERWPMRHFLVYIGSHGALEVIAKEWEVSPHCSDPG